MARLIKSNALLVREKTLQIMLMQKYRVNTTLKT